MVGILGVDTEIVKSVRNAITETQRFKYHEQWFTKTTVINVHCVLYVTSCKFRTIMYLKCNYCMHHLRVYKVLILVHRKVIVKKEICLNQPYSGRGNGNDCALLSRSRKFDTQSILCIDSYKTCRPPGKKVIKGSFSH